MKNDMDIDIKEILLATDDLEIPQAIVNGIDDVLNRLPDIESDKTEMNIKRGLRLNKLSKVAIIILALISITISANAFTKGDTFKQISNFIVEKIMPKSSNPISDFYGFKNSKVDDYKSVIEKSVTDNGITIKINDVVMDEDQVIVTYTVSQSKKDFSKLLPPFVRFFINNKEMEKGFTGSYIEVNKNTRRYIQTMDLRDNKFKGNLNIKIKVSDLLGVPEKDKFWSGNWQFNFVANREKLMAKVRTIKINRAIRLKYNNTVTVDNIVLTPISTTISFHNKHEGILTDSNKIANPYIQIYDKDGNKIKPTGGHYGGGSLDMSTSKSFIGQGYNRFVYLNKNINKLKIVINANYSDSRGRDSVYDKTLKKKAIEVDIK